MQQQQPDPKAPPEVRNEFHILQPNLIQSKNKAALIYDVHLIDREKPRPTPVYPRQDSVQSLHLSRQASQQQLQTPNQIQDAHLMDHIVDRPLNRSELEAQRNRRRNSLNQFIEQHLQPLEDKLLAANCTEVAAPLFNSGTTIPSTNPDVDAKNP